MKKQIISCAAVLAMLGTAVCVPESSISCLTTLSLHTAAEETDTPDDAATESQVYDTSTLTLGTKLSQGDTLHYDKQNVGSVANIVNAKGDYDLAFISEEDYVLPFDAEVVGITALTIYLAPAVDGTNPFRRGHHRQKYEPPLLRLRHQQPGAAGISPILL